MGSLIWRLRVEVKVSATAAPTAFGTNTIVLSTEEAMSENELEGAAEGNMLEDSPISW